MIGRSIERYPILIPLLVRICIKGALDPGAISREMENLGIRMDSRLKEGILRSLEEVAGTLVFRKGSSLYCRLCRGGPYTRRGVYLHLLRIHLRDIESVVKEELERVISQL